MTSGEHWAEDGMMDGECSVTLNGENFDVMGIKFGGFVKMSFAFDVVPDFRR
jgi:hypothetical protein